MRKNSIRQPNEYLTIFSDKRTVVRIWHKDMPYDILIDEDDLDLIKKYQWHLFWNPRSKTFYARNRKANIQMHALIMNSKGKTVDHKNHNGLDNKKDNLRIVNASENALNRRNPAKCVYYNKSFLSKKKWQVIIRSKFYGNYHTKEKAIHRAEEVKKELGI